MKPIKAAYISAVLYLCPATSICASDLWGVTVGNSQSIVLREIDMQTGAVSGSISTGMGLTFTSVDDLASDPYGTHPLSGQSAIQLQATS